VQHPACDQPLASAAKFSSFIPRVVSVSEAWRNCAAGVTDLGSPRKSREAFEQSWAGAAFPSVWVEAS